MSSGLSTGFLLDRQCHWPRGKMETTKKTNPELAQHLRSDEREVLDRLPK